MYTHTHTHGQIYTPILLLVVLNINNYIRKPILVSTNCLITNGKTYSTFNNKSFLQVNVFQTKGKLSLNCNLANNKAYCSYIGHDINLRLTLFLSLNK